MKHAQKSSRPQVDSETLNGVAASDPVVAWMLKNNVPVTRQNYLELAYPSGRPRPWTAELEAELPDFLQFHR